MNEPFIITGKCSTFGGPQDQGVARNEDLALYQKMQLAAAPHGMFLDEQPEGTTGTARRLNPAFPYIAMRWAYRDATRAMKLPGLGVCMNVTTPRTWLMRNTVTVSNPARPDLKPVQAYAADWGPNSDTGRVADLSPGILAALALETDSEVTITITA